MSPIDPSFLTRGPGSGFDIGGLGQEGTPIGVGSEPAKSGGFGDMLSKSISSLERTQVEAGKASRALADGTASDPTEAVMAVERAKLSMQLASQIRTKGVEAINDIFHTTV